MIKLMSNLDVAADKQPLTVWSWYGFAPAGGSVEQYVSSMERGVVVETPGKDFPQSVAK